MLFQITQVRASFTLKVYIFFLLILNTATMVMSYSSDYGWKIGMLGKVRTVETIG